MLISLRSIIITCLVVSFSATTVHAETPRLPFAVQVIQGKDVLKAKNGIYSISRQEPFNLRLQAPAKMKLALLVKGSGGSQVTLDEKSHLYAPEKLNLGVDAKKYGLISDTEYSWLLLSEDNATKKSVQRKRWVNKGIDGFMMLSGSHWKLGTYILTPDLDVDIASIPVDNNGNLDFKKKVQYSRIKIHLLDASQDDNCHLTQNLYRNGGFNPPSCEEIKKMMQTDVTSSSSSSVSPAQSKDVLPFNQPRSSILVLGTLSPVVDVCQTAMNTVLLSGQDDSGRDLSEIRAYDITTKDLLSIATKDGAGKNTGWSSKTYPSKPFYVRWLPRAFTATDKTASDFSTKHRIGVTKKCDGSPSVLGFSIAPSAITNVRSSGPESLKVGAGRGITIGAFTFTATKSSADLKTFLEQIKFTALVTGSVTLSDIKISMQSQGSSYKTECLYNDPPYVTCAIPDYMGEVSGDTTYTLTADISKTSSAGSVQLMLSDFGTPFTPGSVFWKNDAESFKWMSPLSDTVKGTKYELM